MDYPLYRKYKNGKSYFEIHDPQHFTEYKLEFGKIGRYHFQADILPNRNYLHDMIHDYEESWDRIKRQDLLDFIDNYAG